MRTYNNIYRTKYKTTFQPSTISARKYRLFLHLRTNVWIELDIIQKSTLLWKLNISCLKNEAILDIVPFWHLMDSSVGTRFYVTKYYVKLLNIFLASLWLVIKFK